MILRCCSYSRAGLLGNPSDGYFGKTISFSFANFCSKVVIYESPEICLVPGSEDDGNFDNFPDMVREIERFGYYGGIRVVKATAKVFYHYCQSHGIELPARNFTLRYQSNIPRLVGLSGSSGISTAVMRALIAFYEVDEHIPLAIVPTLCWRAEQEELQITCGMQDRVIQIYNGLMYMDFEKEAFLERGYGDYRRIDFNLLPNIYIAYDPHRAEFSGTYHRKLRALFEQERPDIISAMSEFADIARQGYEALMAGKPEKLPALINANFDLRDRIFNVSPENKRMVEYARKTGASAKFAGSGGAIVGSYECEQMYERLKVSLAEIGCEVIKPDIAGTLTP
ncbi:MAG: GHMP kinase [Oligosphaeraceae bacterium]|nr:GHMP kinase [Oligosphaeraceae bacterium]